MTQIHTYHCTCTQLLLATPYELSNLPKRQAPGLDGARILPLGKPSANQEDEQMLNPDAFQGDHGSVEADNDELGRVQYSLLLNTTLDRRAVVVRREDGFEKRWIRRCARCRTGIGYVLNESLGRGEGKGLVYLLDDGLVNTNRIKARSSEDLSAD